MIRFMVKVTQQVDVQFNSLEPLGFTVHGPAKGIHVLKKGRYIKGKIERAYAKERLC